MSKTLFSLLLIVTLFFLAACGPSREELARDAFNRAQKLYEEKQFNDTKLLLDSILLGFSDQIEYVTRSNDLLRTITVSEQEENLIFLDSLLKQKEEELVPLMKNFIESDEYGHKTILIHKRQKPENSYNRVFLRVHLDTEGDFYISSRYTGDSWIYHRQIKVYYTGNEAKTEEIEEDGFTNRRFEDGGTKWEIVNYKDGKDNGVIDFIAANSDQSLKVQFIGKKHYYIVMEKFDKEAIRDANEISIVLKDIHRIKAELKNVKQQLNQLKPKGMQPEPAIKDSIENKYE